MTDTVPSTVVLFVSGDLFLGSRVRGAIESRGWTLQVASSGARAATCLQENSHFRLVLVDLETPGLQIGELVAFSGDERIPLVAYGPHVHERRLDAARKAGCTQVLTRGQFDATLPQLLDQYLS